MAVDSVRLNGTIYSWLSCEFTIDGQEYEGFTDVEYEQKRERKVVFAARRDGTPLGKTAGKYTVPTLTFKVLRATAKMIKEYLTGEGNGSYGDAVFSFGLSVYEPDVNDTPITVIFDTCTWDGEKAGQSEGVDELLTEITIGCLAITENQMQLWSALRSQT
jgi:hypothetical protein